MPRMQERIMGQTEACPQEDLVSPRRVPVREFRGLPFRERGGVDMIHTEHIFDAVRAQGFPVHMFSPYCDTMLASHEGDGCPETCEARPGCRMVREIQEDVTRMRRAGELD